jgi:Cu(I)/Ag(I) efflux system membrane protein CusA/SilA
MVYFMGLIYLCRCSRVYRTFGMAIETAMIMTIYLNEAMNKMVEKHGNSSKTITTDILRQYIIDGSAKG